MSNNSNDTTASSGFILGDKVYMRLKFLVLILLPAMSSLYYSLGAIWHFPNVEQVIGTISVFTAFLGLTLGLSSQKFNSSDAKYDGAIVTSETENGGTLHTLELNIDPASIQEKSQLLLKVTPKIEP